MLGEGRLISLLRISCLSAIIEAVVRASAGAGLAVMIVTPAATVVAGDYFGFRNGTVSNSLAGANFDCYCGYIMVLAF